MSELRDPAIKLFGKTISFPQNEPVSIVYLRDDHNPDVQSSSEAAVSDENKNASGEDEEEDVASKNESDSSNPTAEEESLDPATESGISDEQKISSSAADNETMSPPKDEQKEDQDQDQEKTLKKPDKIIPCPRCNSMDTKFCYYNNYNVNQPRHFCKNCQRYWTAGGTMRNVPVGSGRRKNKSTCSSQYRHIMVSDALQAAARGDGANGIHHHLPSLKSNGTVLTFGSEKPLCESISSVLDLAERSKNQIPEMGSGISSSNSNSTEKGVFSSEQIPRSCQSYIPHPWPYHPWNSPQWRTPLPPPPSMNPSGFPITFYPAPPYWGWNMPWIPQGQAPTSPDHSAMSSSPTPPTLGKHSRDGNILSPPKNSREERSILIPKTLRIDDPNEAAKSSIWSTLGIKNESLSSMNGTARLFKAFPNKGNSKNHHHVDVDDTSLVLQANPAAYSRSRCFHEST